MEEIKKLLVSPAFWVSSVAIAFLMSFFASYTKDWTDKWFQKRSAKKDEQARQRQKDFDEKVARLRTDQTLLALYQSNIVYQKLRQVLYLIVCYVLLALGVYAATQLDFVAAAVMIGIALLLLCTQTRSVSKMLYELRSVVNAALGDKETHFYG